MDAILEILMEMLGTAIVEGGGSAASDRRRPVWQRVLVLALLALFCAAVFAVILLVGVGALPDLPVISLFLFALDAIWVFLCVRRFRKILRTFSRK
ncbi:MAG: hypothetical protein K2P08_07290 [Oscillospiraceae bacterium]|nr:hypothetical protein [Oscillospiraceae bacterium]